MDTSTPNSALELNANAITVLERRYLVKDEKGQPVERAQDLFWRVARTIAAPDRADGASEKGVGGGAETFYDVSATPARMADVPTPLHGGRPLGQLSARLHLPGREGVPDRLSR